MIQKGKGKDLLLLHGYGSCKESFYYQTEFFCRNFRVTSLDILGFGKSDALTQAFSVGDYADWLNTFVVSAGINNPYIIAHSFGARIAIKAIADNKDFAERLLITGGAGVVKPRSPAYMRQVNRYRRIKKIFPRYAERHFGSEEYRQLSPVQKQSYKKIVNEDLRMAASRITIPTLLVYGCEDTVTPAAQEGAIFQRAIGGSILHTIAGGHFCFAQNASTFNSAALAFFMQRL